MTDALTDAELDAIERGTLPGTSKAKLLAALRSERTQTQIERDMLRDALPTVAADARYWDEGSGEYDNKRRREMARELEARIRSVLDRLGRVDD